MLSGFIFRHFFQDELLFARDELQELAFFLVLLTAGLEIRVEQLKWHIFVMAILPAACEILGIALYAYYVMQYTRLEGLVLGSVLAALGDGLVIPKMQEFSQSFPGHALPRLVSTWAPVEASFVLTTFGVLAGLATPEAATAIHRIVLANALRLVATLLVGIIFGAISGGFMNAISDQDFGPGIFTGSTSERLLMLLATTLWAFALGQGDEGHELVPMGFAKGSMFQPELLVIVTGACFAKISDHEILQKIEIALRDVWTFGQIFLFSMLGSKITPDLLPQLGHILPVMLVGLVWRLLGVALGILITCHSRERPRSILPDTMFCFLCTLPRATIQGALGGKPKELHFFGASLVCSYIFTAAQLYILCYSVTGMILLHTLGPKLLEWSEQLQKSPDSRIQQVAAKTELERTALLDSESAKSPSRRSSSAGTEPGSSSQKTAASNASFSTIHGFDNYQPSLLGMKGRKETQDAKMLDASTSPKRQEVVVKALRPQKVTLKVSRAGPQEVQTKDGTISVDIPARAVGETFEFNFGPAPDYVLRAPWAPTERHYDFGRSDGRALHVPVPAGQKRVFLIPKGLMLDIPNGTSPGAVLCFKHPDKAAVSNWFTTRLPKNWRAGKRYLPVRLPKEEYQFEYGSGNFFQDMCQQFLLLIEQMWEDFTQMCQNCRFWR